MAVSQKIRQEMGDTATAYDELTGRINWRLSDPRYSDIRSEQMQRQFSIELRVEYMDEGKYVELKRMLQAAAVQLYASAALIADGQTPTIAIAGTDFFHGYEEIKLLENTIAKGKESIGGGAEEISQELMDALK